MQREENGVSEDRKRYQRGLKRRRQVLGEAYVERALANTTAFNADFQRLITEYAWDAIWNRPGLPAKTRRMLVLAMTIAQGRWEEFDLHLRAVLEQRGLTLNEVKEVLLQSAVYCGVPAANTAFKRAAVIIDETKKSPSRGRAKR